MLIDETITMPVWIKDISICISASNCPERECYHKQSHPRSYMQSCDHCHANEYEGHRMNGIFGSYCIPVDTIAKEIFYKKRLEEIERSKGKLNRAKKRMDDEDHKCKEIIKVLVQR